MPRETGDDRRCLIRSGEDINYDTSAAIRICSLGGRTFGCKRNSEPKLNLVNLVIMIGSRSEWVVDWKTSSVEVLQAQHSRPEHAIRNEQLKLTLNLDGRSVIVRVIAKTND